MKLETPSNIGRFVYMMPENEFYSDIMWHGQFFLNRIDFDSFYYLLTAVLLEKSVVFVCSNLNMLSSMVNGFRILIRPFKWCHLFIAILPNLLSDYVYAPQPMLIGVADINDIIEAAQSEA